MAEVITRDPYYAPGYFVAQVINVIFGIIEFLLLVRVVLELLAANASAPFIAWIYQLTGGLMGPFVNAFPNLALGGGSFIDVVAILAMIVYAVIGWIILQLCWALFSSFN